MKYICEHCNAEVFSDVSKYKYCPFCGKPLVKLNSH